MANDIPAGFREGIASDGTVGGYDVETRYQALRKVRLHDGYLAIASDAGAVDAETRIPPDVLDEVLSGRTAAGAPTGTLPATVAGPQAGTAAMPFRDWIARVEGELASDVEHRSWRQCFDRGLSPAEAVAESRSEEYARDQGRGRALSGPCGKFPTLLHLVLDELEYLLSDLRQARPGSYRATRTIQRVKEEIARRQGKAQPAG